MRIALSLLIIAAMTAGLAPALEIGDEAPPVEVSTWLKGEGMNPAEPDGKHIYVVELWATWCGPCKQVVPILNALHEEYEDDGVVIMGITQEDVETVKAHLDEPEKHYHIGVDKDSATTQAYQSAAGSIPHAAVVNKEGIVAWTGHPGQGIDEVVKEMVAGTFDMEKWKKIAQAQSKLQSAQSAQEAMAAVDELIALRPADSRNYMLKTMLLQRTGRSAAVGSVYEQWAEGVADDAEGLTQLVMMLVGQDNLALKRPELALESARKAVKLTGGKEPQAVLALARALGDVGKIDQAITTLKDADEQVASAPPIQAALDYYKKVAAIK